jgi:hypothetical protein
MTLKNFRKGRGAPKGRQVDPAALAEVQTLLGEMPRRRDLLIEHLHKIQDRYRQLASAHLAALAQEMKLSQAEVFEVASFYHHFDIVASHTAALRKIRIAALRSSGSERSTPDNQSGDLSNQVHESDLFASNGLCGGIPSVDTKSSAEKSGLNDAEFIS